LRIIPAAHDVLEVGPFLQYLLSALIIIPEIGFRHLSFKLGNPLSFCIDVKGTPSAQRAFHAMSKGLHSLRGTCLSPDKWFKRGIIPIVGSRYKNKNDLKNKKCEVRSAKREQAFSHFSLRASAFDFFISQLATAKPMATPGTQNCLRLVWTSQKRTTNRNIPGIRSPILAYKPGRAPRPTRAVA
jgi:hypothetical protein